MLVSGTDFSLALRVALASSQAALVMSIVLVAWILVLRARLNAGRKRRAALINVWRPILADVALDPAARPQLPALARRDLPGFLREWNAMQDALTGGAKLGLNALVARVGCVERIRALLGDKRPARQSLATTALGHLHDREAWPALLSQLDSASHVLSLLAARALMQIDPGDALPAVLARISERPDWPAGRVAALLAQAGPDVVTGPLCTEIVRGPAERTVRLLPFIGSADQRRAADTIRRLLQTSEHEPVICECLRVAHDPSLLELVRQHLTHEQWFVRLLAVEALGRNGVAHDVPRIVELLDDSQWWVRYRAAQALVRFPQIGTAELERIRAGVTDRYARNILEHAHAERRFQ